MNNCEHKTSGFEIAKNFLQTSLIRNDILHYVLISNILQAHEDVKLPFQNQKKELFSRFTITHNQNFVFTC